MNDLAIHYCRFLDATQVAELLGLPKAKERHKWACPACGSHDGLHVYPGPGRGSYCYTEGKSYDAIDLTKLVLGHDFLDSVRWLAGEFGFADLIDGKLNPKEAKKHREEVKREQKRLQEERERLDKKTQQKAREVYDRLWPMLRLGRKAKAYLEERAIPAEVAHHLGIRSVESKQEWKDVRLEFWPPELDVAGLTGRGDDGEYPLPWLTPFLVIPYWLEQGGVDTLRFRDISGCSSAKYINPRGRGQGPSGAYLSHGSSEMAARWPVLYVCEGELDAVSVVVEAGPAISSTGSGGWRDEWTHVFAKFDHVVIIADGDDGGDAFIRRVVESAWRTFGVDWVRAHLQDWTCPPKKDANDLLKAGTLADQLQANFNEYCV